MEKDFCDCDGQCDYCKEHGCAFCADKAECERNNLVTAVIGRQLIDEGHGDVQHCITDAAAMVGELKPVVRRAISSLFEALESSPGDIADVLDEEVRTSKKEDGVYISDFTRGIEYAAGVVRGIADRHTEEETDEAAGAGETALV